MSSPARKLYPNVGLNGATLAVTYDDGTTPFPAAGAFVPWNLYYAGLYASGKLVDYDPLTLHDAGAHDPAWALSAGGAIARSSSGAAATGAL